VCLGHVFLFVLLSAPATLFAQTLQTWEDQFLDRSKIQSLQNVVIDTVQGLITLEPIRETNTQGQPFRVVLSGIDKSFYEPTGIANFPLSNANVVDIDPVPGQPDLYLVTDLSNRVIFAYNAATNRAATTDLASGLGVLNPQDAFPYIDGNNTAKVLITDSDPSQVLKINVGNLNLEWSFQSGLLRPSDAIVLPRSEVLICDSGNDRIVAVDTTTDLITWEFGSRSIFSNPVDVDLDPTSAGNVDVYLVTDMNNHRVVLVRRDNSEIVFQFGKTGVSGNTDSTLTFPVDADPLPNGNVIIADAGNNRLIEVNRQGQIVWRFAREVFGLRDVDRIASDIHRDKTLVAGRENASASVVTAKRFSYESEEFISPPKDFGQPVDFDSLFFTGIIPSETGIRLRLRTVQDLSDTTNAVWYGPKGTGDYYTTSPSLINPIHDGDRFYQFRAFLDTQNRLKTPELLSVDVKATYFRADTQGVVLSRIVRDSADAIITNWRTLRFTTQLPIPSDNLIVVEVLDSLGTTSFASYHAGQSPDNSFDIDPDRVSALKGHQALRLRATLSTTNAFASPKLLSWAVEWNSVKLGPSQTSFVNAIGTRVSRYRVNTTPGDSVYIQVADPNVLPLSDSVQVEVRSTLAGDSERVLLVIDRASRAFYRSKTGLRLVLAGQTATSNNNLLEVRDRDDLTVSYVDPFDPGDQSNATAQVIQNARGTIQIEGSNGVARDSVDTTDLIFVRVLGETDRNLSPTQQDTIVAQIFDPRSTDLENIILVELPDQSNAFNTGNFITPAGIGLVGTGSPQGDGKLYVVGGSTVTARFKDPDARLDEPPIEDFVPVRPGGGDIFVTSNDKFALEIAPNPYRVRNGGAIKLRAQVRSGSLMMRRVEIFNLAGEKVTTIPEGSIRFGSSPSIGAAEGPVVALDWWNVQGDDGQPVATGTYFAKFHVTLTGAGGDVNQITDLKKLVILQ
jgi:hypothetical protein